MRSPNDVYAELEEARAFREGEVRLLQNLSESEQDSNRQAALRRSLLLITYAHLEGFARFSMEAYASAVNSAEVACGDAVAPLVALTLHKLFAALRHPQSKHPAFASELPNDSDLHMSWREQRFVEQLQPLMDAVVAIPDGSIDLESNLRPAVLKRNLYRLGLNFAVVESHSGDMSMLLGRRNQIAHGDTIVPAEADVEKYITLAFDIMQFLQAEIFKALSEEAYRKPAA